MYLTLRDRGVPIKKRHLTPDQLHNRFMMYGYVKTLEYIMDVLDVSTHRDDCDCENCKTNEVKDLKTLRNRLRVIVKDFNNVSVK